MSRSFCLAVALGLCAAAQPLAAAPGVDSPEPVIRAFYRALLQGDTVAYHQTIVEDPRADKFLMKQPPDADKAHEIDMESQAFTMRQLQPFRSRGKETSPVDGKYPVGTTTRYLANFPASLTVISVVRAKDGWKVDMRWWDAIAELMQKDVENGTPEYAVKSLLASLVFLKKDEAKKYIVPDGDLDVLFAGAPSQPEPSDQLISLVGEMPVVEIGPGEFYPMPSGRVVEGLNDADHKLLVGLFGPREIPFLVHKAAGEWRVAVEPYFTIIEW
jgi:hypothetical protein